MYVESISRLTASEESGPFMRLRPENVNEVFQSLVKMGDVAHALRDDSIPMPTITLTAQTYAETMLTHLRPPYRDVENFAESVDNYDLDDDDFQSASPWLDVEALENIRVDLKKQAARVTDDRCDGILRRWNTAKDTLVELAKYCGEVLEAMGPSFLERVAADFRSGRYAPPSADGVLIPEDAIPEDSRAKRRERELLEAGRVLREAFDKDPLSPSNKRKAPPPASRDDDVEAAAVRRNVTAFEKLKAANAAVADPLKEALRASDAAGAGGGRRRRGRQPEGGGVERPRRGVRGGGRVGRVGRVPGGSSGQGQTRGVESGGPEEGRHTPAPSRGYGADGGLGFPAATAATARSPTSPRLRRRGRRRRPSVRSGRGPRGWERRGGRRTRGGPARRRRSCEGWSACTGLGAGRRSWRRGGTCSARIARR